MMHDAMMGGGGGGVRVRDVDDDDDDDRYPYQIKIKNISSQFTAVRRIVAVSLPF